MFSFMFLNVEEYFCRLTLPKVSCHSLKAIYDKNSFLLLEIRGCSLQNVGHYLGIYKVIEL